MMRILILGRPNVGKSTFINRLLKQKKSIQSSVSGVTRDYIEYPWIIADESVVLVDSAGVGGDVRDEISTKAIANTLEQIDQADIVLFMISVETLSGEDHLLAQRLRAYKEKTILLVNKVDLDPYSSDAHSLGFEQVFFLSAEHNREIAPFLSYLHRRITFLNGGEQGSDEAAEEVLEDSQTQDAPAHTSVRKGRSVSIPDCPRICVVGRPNVGKSSLLNALVGFDRAIVSDISGTTRDAVSQEGSLDGKQYTIIDTAGLRRKKKNRDAIEFYAQLRSQDAYTHADCCILLIDASEGITEQDMSIAQWLEREGRAYVVLCNKWDLIQEKEGYAMIQKAKDLHGIFRYALIVPCSVKTGSGLQYIPEYVERLVQESYTNISTGVLNSHLERWINHSPPRSAKTMNIRIRYGTQIGVNPLRFLFFANKHAKELKTYARYLESCIRREFGILHVPIQISIRTKSPND